MLVEISNPSTNPHKLGGFIIMDMKFFPKSFHPNVNLIIRFRFLSITFLEVEMIVYNKAYLSLSFFPMIKCRK